ncbi:MAG: hypothetical protein V3T83_15640 [Acidobacteriota bacterium]
MTQLEETFGDIEVPQWLRDFERDPYAAVDDALWGRCYFGSLNVAEPSQLVIDWTLGLENSNGFTARLDQALAEWARKTWGLEPCAGGRSPQATAVAWIQLADIVANLGALREAPGALRERWEERQAYLGPISKGSACDPLGRYLLAVARHQEDRSLLPFWWKCCELEEGVPLHHGWHGIQGLRGLPPRSQAERGRFPRQVAVGVAKLARAVHRRQGKLGLTPEQAKSAFLRVARVTMAAYPFPEKWQAIWAEIVAAKKGFDGPSHWMSELVPNLLQSTFEAKKKPVRVGPSPDWSRTGKQL